MCSDNNNSFLLFGRYSLLIMNGKVLNYGIFGINCLDVIAFFINYHFIKIKLGLIVPFI